MAEQNNKPNRFANIFDRLKGFNARNIVKSIEGGINRFKKFIELSRTTFYRLNVINNDSLEQVATYRLSLMNLYVWISSLLVGFSIFLIALIVFTPLKRFIPGYGGIGSQRDVFLLENRVDSLERAVRAHQTYTTNKKKWLNNEVERQDDINRDKTTAVADSNINTDAGEYERQIRAGGNSPFDGDEVAQNTEGGITKAIKIIGRTDRLENMFLASPLSGQVSKNFTMGQKHYGIDIIAPKNTPIKAIADGFVISSDWTLETGNTIAIQHNNNVVSFYKHNSVLLKKTGDRVKSGEAIAIIGNTGEQTTGPHLHFELWKDGRALNPAEYIRF
jgi:murein DD-endopeptidase MepM/ murein hydrolase activator NlpD